MKRIFALVVLVLVPSAARAQTLGSIIGRVVDARSDSVLAGAAVTVVGTNLRAITGRDGRFVIGSVPPGERTLRVEQLGFRTVVLEGILVRTGQSQDVRIPLDIAPVVMQGVVVEAERRRII